MKNIYIKAKSIAVIALVFFSLVPLGITQGQSMAYERSFLLLNHPDGDITYELNVTIPQLLYQYYTMQNHALFSDSDFAKFVTPYTLKPIADKLWQIYNNTEDFTNGVLMLVHQIGYRETVPGKYPVETLVDGVGDCDLFAYIAASILEAGGIPVVLLYYKNQLHMEISVDLGYAPIEARVEVYSVNIQNDSYYIAECTGDNWREGWRVGETPSEYQNVSSQVSTLESMEQSSIGQVSASLRELDHSTLSLQISSSIIIENSELTLTGQIYPQVANENVTLQARIYSDSWTNIATVQIATVQTQAEGRFEYNWIPPSGGIIKVQASWVGNRQYNGATSSQTNVIILPILLFVLILCLVLTVVFLMLVYFKTRHKNPDLKNQD
jgi:hypothetical protein